MPLTSFLAEESGEMPRFALTQRGHPIRVNVDHVIYVRFVQPLQQGGRAHERDTTTHLQMASRFVQ